MTGAVFSPRPDGTTHLLGLGRTYGSWQSGPLAGLGQGTNLHSALRDQFDPARHDRAVVFTDDQSHDTANLSAHIPEITYFNLGGYAPQSDWGKRRFHFGGFSDAGLVAIHDLA